MTTIQSNVSCQDNEWRWKRVRNIALGVVISPLHWHFGPWREDDFYGGRAGFVLGPVGVTIYYDAMDGIIARVIGPHCEMDVRP